MRGNNAVCWHVLAAFLALAVTSIAAPGGAQGVDPQTLPSSLRFLPQVDGYRLDDRSHLVQLSGRLTPPTDSLPRDVVVSFLRVHAELYPAAPETFYRLEWVTEVGDGYEVSIRQLVAGFASEDDIRAVVSPEGAILAITGVVLHGGETEAPRGPAISAAEAERIAADAFSAARPGWRPGATPAERAATRLILRDYRRVWRVEVAAPSGRRYLRLTAFVDAFSGQILQSSSRDVTHLRPGSSGHPTPPTEGGSILGCQPSEPPFGDFVDPERFGDWAAADLTWSAAPDPPPAAEFLTGGSLRGDDYGRINRTTSVPAHYSMLKLFFPYLQDSASFVFRWGSLEANSISFTAPKKKGTPPYLDVTATLYLDDTPTWPPPRGQNQFTLQFMTKDRSGLLSQMQMLPGARLEFASEPRLVQGGMTVTSALAGTTLELRQVVVNNGCALRAVGSEAQRAVSYTACKDGSTTTCGVVTCPPDAPEPGTAARIGGALAAGLLATYDLCRIALPESSPEVAGAWTLHGVFDDTSKDPTDLVFNVEHGLVPNLMVYSLPQTRIEAWSVSPDGQNWTRLETLTVNTPFVLSVTLGSEVVSTHDVTVELRARGRVAGGDSGEWHNLGRVQVATVETEGGTPVYPELVLPASIVPAGETWCLVDLEVVLDPDNLVEELPPNGEGDNVFDVNRWIPVAADDLGDAIGAPTLQANFDDEGAPISYSGLTASIDEGRLRLVRVDEPGTPYVAWANADPAHQVNGVMVRYQRVEWCCQQPYLVAGRYRDDAIMDLPPMPPDLGGTAENLYSMSSDGQWHVALWTAPSDGPFLGMFGVKELTDPFGRSSGSPETLGVSETYLGVDTGNQCPSPPAGCEEVVTEVDFVRAWRSEGGPSPTWDAAPLDLMVLTGQGWTTMPQVVGTDLTLTIGIAVSITLGHAHVPPGSLSVAYALRDQTFSADQAPSEISPGLWVYKLTQLWATPADDTEVEFDVSLTITPDPTDPENGANNRRVLGRRIASCVPRVVLP